MPVLLLQESGQPFRSKPVHPRLARVLWLEIHGFSWLPFLIIKYEGLTEAWTPQPEIVYRLKYQYGTEVILFQQ